MANHGRIRDILCICIITVALIILDFSLLPELPCSLEFLNMYYPN
jgi:hypothetical protein